MPLTGSKWGAWGNGLVNNVSQFNQLLPYINGFNFRPSWTDIQTGASTFTWTYFDEQLNYAFDNDLYVGFMIFTGPNAPITGSNNWLASLVPTFTNDRGTYPYYLDSDYISYWYAMTDAVVAHLSSYPTEKKNKILFYMSAEGSTGDEGPYKGIVPTTPFDFTIDIAPDGEWDEFKRDYWTYLYNKLADDFPSCNLLINQGNDGGNFQWGLDNIPSTWMKAGNFTHTYSLPGEKQYSLRLDSLRDSPTDENRVRGEFEGTDSQAWWQLSTKQNFLALLCSALHANIDIFNIAASTHIQNGYTAFPYEFYDEFAGIRDATDANSAFIMFRDEIDILDTTRFSTGTYGALVTQNVSEFTTKYNNINAQTYAQSIKDDRITSLYLTPVSSSNPAYKYFNPTRVTNIRNFIPSASYLPITPDQQRDTYNSGYSANSIPDNYQRFVTQYSPNTTSTGAWNFGPTNQYYGRYGRIPSPEIFLTFDPLLDSGGDNNVTIQLSYLDEGTGMWSVNCATCKGRTEICAVQNKNTNSIITRTITVDKFLFGGNLSNSSDLSIKTLSGTPTKFSFLKLTNNSKILV